MLILLIRTSWKNVTEVTNFDLGTSLGSGALKKTTRLCICCTPTVMYAFSTSRFLYSRLKDGAASQFAQIFRCKTQE